MAEVSAVIPTICRREQLQRAVNSVLGQDFSGIELIIVNDSSFPEDQSWLEKRFPDKAKIYKTDGNSGANAARNLGIEHATGKYIAFLDDDDEWLPNKISEQLNLFKSSGAGLCYTGKNIINDITGSTEWYSFEKPRCKKSFPHIFYKNFIGTTSCVMIKKSLFDEIGTFDENLPALQDMDLFIRIAKKVKIAGIDAGLVNYYSDFSRTHTSLNTEAYKKAVAILLEKYKNEKSFYLFRLGLAVNKIRKSFLKYSLVRKLYSLFKQR